MFKVIATALICALIAPLALVAGILSLAFKS
jgi:hypothetical protein